MKTITKIGVVGGTCGCWLVAARVNMIGALREEKH